jgi:hypothetical protein
MISSYESKLIVTSLSNSDLAQIKSKTLACQRNFFFQLVEKLEAQRFSPPRKCSDLLAKTGWDRRLMK